MSNKFSTITVSKRYCSISQDDEKQLYDSDDNEIKMQSKQKSKFAHFGLRYFYDKTIANKNETKYATFVKKKYKSFQRELTNNSLYKIELVDWKQQMFNAKIYAESLKNRYYYQCSLESILSIIFYSNFEKLQAAFKGSYILISKQDNYQLAAQRNHEFVNWAMILNETINAFGKRGNDECCSNEKFYHGLIEPITEKEVGTGAFTLDFNFNESYMRFYCPLLASTSIEVLLHYLRDKNGMLLSLCPTNGGGVTGVATYFDCVWLSYFENEEAKLFMHNNKYIMQPSIMRINDMIDTLKYYNFGNYLNGISILNCIINNEMILFETNQSMFDALGKLISHRLRPISYNKNNKQEAYIDAIFARFCQLQTGIITIDMNQISSLCINNKNANSFLRNYLISQTANKNVFVLKCHNFVELFPRTPSIEIQNCCLNAIMFELICQSLKLQENKIDLELIEFNNINEELSQLTCDEIVTKYRDKLDVLAWIISKTEFKEIKLEKLKYIQLNPKCKLSVNIFNAAFYYGNAERKNTDQNQKEIKTSHGIYQIKVEYFNIRKNKNKNDSNDTWIVDKRYSEFLRLHKYCIKKRDGIKPINLTKVKFPPKTLFRKPNTTNVMEERRGKFEQYIQYLLITSYKHQNKIYLKKLSHFLSPQ